LPTRRRIGAGGERQAKLVARWRPDDSHIASLVRIEHVPKVEIRGCVVAQNGEFLPSPKALLLDPGTVTASRRRVERWCC
jgi:hypothetical protein